MKTSVCIFFDESDAKETIRHLRRRHLGVTLVSRNVELNNEDELHLSVLAAERPEHPLILDRIAEMDSMHQSLVRCTDCRSVRLSIGLKDNPPPALRLARSLLEKLALRPHEVTQTIICRDCSSTVELSKMFSPHPTGGAPVIDAIAA